MVLPFSLHMFLPSIVVFRAIDIVVSSSTLQKEHIACAVASSTMKTPSHDAKSAPDLSMDLSNREPSKKLMESISSDLPAPVSPDKILKPSPN